MGTGRARHTTRRLNLPGGRRHQTLVPGLRKTTRTIGVGVTAGLLSGTLTLMEVTGWVGKGVGSIATAFELFPTSEFVTEAMSPPELLRKALKAKKAPNKISATVAKAAAVPNIGIRPANRFFSHPVSAGSLTAARNATKGESITFSAPNSFSARAKVTFLRLKGEAK